MNHRQTLVLMPGLDGTGKLFAPILPWLDAHFDLRVLTYPDLDSFQEYIDCAQNQLPPAADFSLLAESFSGPIAMALMANRSGQIGPSVLCATFARSPLATMTMMANHLPSQIFSIGALGEFYMDVEDVDKSDFSETQPLPLDVTAQIDGTVLKHRISVMSRIDVSALLPQIAAPVLCLHGMRDRIVSEHDARLIEDHLPGVRRVNIDAPHLLLQTRPEECARRIIEHIQPGG